MKILHTADLHFGQILYQGYSREEEHQYFFEQLHRWCGEYKPDALLLSGDIFDIQQPSATTRKLFNDYFVALHTTYPDITIVITAGNHDSASRIHADSAVWRLGQVHLVGQSPAVDASAEQLYSHYVVETPTGYIIAFPYMVNVSEQLFQRLLDYIGERNHNNLPVVMMAHLAVSNSDTTGHTEIGKVQVEHTSMLGSGYDYLALGHIHRPQTIGEEIDDGTTKTYPSGVIRYSGSALHVSCDETYPHSVSLVEIDHHGGSVTITPLRIDELLHFYTLPEKGVATTCEEAFAALQELKDSGKQGYFRFRIAYNASVAPDFTTQVYRLIEVYPMLRFNPKVLWEGVPPAEEESTKPKFEVAELQQMEDPLEFIDKTLNQYPALTAVDAEGVCLRDLLPDLFNEIKEKVRIMAEAETSTTKGKKKTNTDTII